MAAPLQRRRTAAAETLEIRRQVTHGEDDRGAAAGNIEAEPPLTVT